MSLNPDRLEQVRELAGGVVQARCPACAEDGHDRSGEHLRIYPDGRFGCCVHPKDRAHRKRIFALAGDKSDLTSPGTFTLRIKTPATLQATESVKAALTVTKLGTLGTGKTESKPSGKQASQTSQTPNCINRDTFGTPGTGDFKLRARTGEDLPKALDIFEEQLKDLESGVPSVPRPVMPYLTAGGDLVIPFESPERYHWWKGGQSIAATRRECGMMKEDGDECV